MAQETEAPVEDRLSGVLVGSPLIALMISPMLLLFSRRFRLHLAACTAGLALLGPALLAAAAPKAPRLGGPIRVEYDRDVRPILASHCFNCHGFDAGKRQADLRLDIPEGALAPRPGGRHAVVPGRPERSALVQRVVARTMPPAGAPRQLSTREIDTLRRWVAQGGKYASHWSLTPPRPPSPPGVRDAAWARNPVDRYVLARLEREGLRPSAEAPPETLIRRVTLDLTGLPSAPDEVEAFVRERAAEPKGRAYERLVDRLLASPRYGERMAWDWLDAARYADTNGYQGDRTRTMWPWRDWVVRAFNADMPFDRFTLEQLAGDLLPQPTVDQRIATGFHRNHMLNGEGGRIPEESRVDYVVDRVDTTATVWMGLTLGCSRCHDHKYDPFTQREYYRLFAFFNNVPETGSVDRAGMANPVLALPTPEQSARLAELNAALRERERELAAAAPEERASVQQRVEAARKAVRDLEGQLLLTMVMEERAGPPRASHVLVRGAYDRPAEKVTAGVPGSLPPLPQGVSGNRLDLARWLVSPEHPLTARVTVNRLWQMLFGTGLVKTPEDFGTQGERPTHPELLDYLAWSFSHDEPGAAPWSVKALLRKIVTSAVYRQASRVSPDLLRRDPENRLLARGPRFRLPAPVLRDQALAVSGLLVEKQGGPPVKPYQPPGVWEEATFGKITYQPDRGENLYRRSLYVFWRRIVGPTNFFDTAARQACTVRQARTNTPLHALVLLNDTTYVEAARTFAQRVLKHEATSPAARLDYAFRLAAARTPTPAERGLLTRSLQRLRTQYSADRAGALALLRVGDSPRDERLDPVEHAAWTGLCSLLLNLDEVVTKE